MDDPRLFYEVAGEVLNRPVDQAFVDWKRGFAAPASAARPGGWQMPYRDFTVEYPPLALGVLALPRLLTDDWVQYAYGFQAMMAVVFLGVGMVLVRLLTLVRPDLELPAAFGWSLALVVLLLTGSYILRRYDLLLSLTLAGALLARLRQRPGLAGLLLGTAAALKLWPVLLLPVFVTYHQEKRGRWKLLAGAAALPVLSHAVLMPMIGMRVFAYLHYHSGRGMQIESLWSSVLMVLSKALTVPSTNLRTHGAMDLGMPVAFPIMNWVATAVMLSAIVICAIAGIAAVRNSEPPRRAQRLVQAMVLMIAGTIVAAKVFSPQYLIWLFPVAFLARQRSVFWLYLLCLLLTRCYFPHFYDVLAFRQWPALLVLLARNAALVALVVMLLRTLDRRIAVQPPAILRPATA
jgi:hypothetical protein